MRGVVTVSVSLLLLQRLIRSVYEQRYRYPMWLKAFKCDGVSSTCNSGNYEYNTLTFILEGAVENAEMLEINMSQFQTRVVFLLLITLGRY